MTIFREEELQKYDEESTKEFELLLSEEKKTKGLQHELGHFGKSKTVGPPKKPHIVKGSSLQAKDKASDFGLKPSVPKLPAKKVVGTIIKKKEEPAKSPPKLFKHIP